MRVSQFVLFLHFVGLMLGATGGFGSALVMRRALAMPVEAAGPLRGSGRCWRTSRRLGWR